MKQKIIDIIGFMEHPEKAELMAEQILELFEEDIKNAYYNGAKKGFYESFDADKYYKEKYKNRA